MWCTITIGRHISMDMLSFDVVYESFNTDIGTMFIHNGAKTRYFSPLWLKTQESDVLGPFYGYEDLEAELGYLFVHRRTPIKGIILCRSCGGGLFKVGNIDYPHLSLQLRDRILTRQR